METKKEFQFSNLRSMFNTAGIICQQAMNNEITEYHNADYALKSLELGLKMMELAHKQSIAMCDYESYMEKWQRITPQGKNYDALPE